MFWWALMLEMWKGQSQQTSKEDYYPTENLIPFLWNTFSLTLPGHLRIADSHKGQRPSRRPHTNYTMLVPHGDSALVRQKDGDTLTSGLVPQRAGPPLCVTLTVIFVTTSTASPQQTVRKAFTVCLTFTALKTFTRLLPSNPPSALGGRCAYATGLACITEIISLKSSPLGILNHGLLAKFQLRKM